MTETKAIEARKRRRRREEAKKKIVEENNVERITTEMPTAGTRTHQIQLKTCKYQSQLRIIISSIPPHTNHTR